MSLTDIVQLTFCIELADCFIPCGERGCAVGWGTSRKVAGPIPNDIIGMFYGHNTSSRHMVLGVISASNRNEYWEYILG